MNAYIYALIDPRAGVGIDVIRGRRYKLGIVYARGRPKAE